MNRYTEIELKWLKSNYPILGSHECAARLGRPLSSVRQTANNLGVRIPKSLVKELMSKSRIKKFIPTISPHIFENVNTKEVAYVLGIMWADGWITNKNYYSIDIKLVKEDFELILPIFEKLGKWKKYEYHPKNRKPTIQLRASGKSLVDVFLNMDYHTKSYTSAEKVLSKIPKNLQKYWWRGYFDGDGHIKVANDGYKRLELSSAWNQDWSFLPKEIPFKIKVTRGKNNYSKATLSSKENILKFGNFVWKNWDGLGMERKYKEFKKLI
jgi:hypothetical protein